MRRRGDSWPGRVRRWTRRECLATGLRGSERLPLSANALAPVVVDGRGVGFLSVFDFALNPLFTTGFPGDGTNLITAIGVISPGRLWIAGTTEAAGLPTPDSSVNAQSAGRTDLYLEVLHWK